MFNNYKFYLTGLILFALSFTIKAQDTFKKDTQWLRFNIQGALLANNSFSNLGFKFLYPSNINETEYSKNAAKPVCFGFNAGAEFLLGRKPKYKQLLSLTYDFTNSSYTDNNSYNEAMFHVPNQTWHETISRQVQFVSLNYGFLFKLSKRLKLAPIFSLSVFSKKTDITNGYYVESMASQRGNPPIYDSTAYHNSKTSDNGLNLIASLKLRASYDITNYLSVFVTRNFGITYKAPWWMIGMQCYPFKKLRN
jgi:hypothetical protein